MEAAQPARPTDTHAFEQMKLSSITPKLVKEVKNEQVAAPSEPSWIDTPRGCYVAYEAYTRGASSDDVAAILSNFGFGSNAPAGNGLTRNVVIGIFSRRFGGFDEDRKKISDTLEKNASSLKSEEKQDIGAKVAVLIDSLEKSKFRTVGAGSRRIQRDIIRNSLLANGKTSRRAVGEAVLSAAAEKELRLILGNACVEISNSHKRHARGVAVEEAVENIKNNVAFLLEGGAVKHRLPYPLLAHILTTYVKVENISQHNEHLIRKIDNKDFLPVHTTVISMNCAGAKSPNISWEYVAARKIFEHISEKSHPSLEEAIQTGKPVFRVQLRWNKYIEGQDGRSRLVILDKYYTL